jgi:hypothetical protein
MRYDDHRVETGRKAKPKRRVPFLRILMAFAAYLLVQPAHQAEAVNISDDPMETKVVTAPPNIMFILDNSGSMDWEFMVKKKMDGTFTADGRFENDYGYLYDSGDNLFSTSNVYGHIVSGANRLKWLSQWSGWNKMYYNPAMTYMPWPTMPDASTSTPRSNPANATPTFNLGNTYYYLSRTETAVIVDNQDGSPYFTVENSNNWTESSRSPEWGASSIYTGTTGESATFTPNITRAGNYAVYGWWNCYTDRDGNAKITIVHSTGSNTVYRSQRATYDNISEAGICGEWIPLGDYPFQSGTAGSVTIERHSGSTGSNTIADAVKFVLQDGLSEDLDIKNAHYYTVDDLNSNGEWDANEPVYLVNFVDGVRRYYQVLDTNGVVASGEVYPISDLPESVRPRFYDDDGTPVYKTDAEDLQNFANWYSYYRRRELAAKAAVSSAINTLEGVRVGFYTINSGLRQPVLPVKSQGNALITDNLDSGYSSSSGWSEASYSNEYKNSSKYTGTSGRWARWTPNLPKTETYKVYAWWNYYRYGDTNALYTINHAGGTDTVRVNQKQNYSQWTLLGTYDFNAGSSGYVQVTRDSQSTGTYTNADAVMFELVDNSYYVDETNTLLNLLYDYDSEGGTPLRLALKEVGKYFNGAENSSLGETGDEPWKSNADGGACQQAFAILMTDGYWNGDSPSVNNQDGDQGSPYADNYSNTLADVAMKYYKTDLSSSLDNSIPTNSCDSATWQHMVTYGVSFGLKGTLDPSAYHPCLLDGSEPVWPNPDPYSDHRECAERIDDLYHATINGRGLFFNASNPEELVSSLAALMENIESRMASGASVSVNGEELGTDTVLYQASYSSDSWTGEVKAFPVDRDTGAILREASDIKWSAADLLQSVAPDDRLIVTYNGTDAGTAFRYISLTAAQKASLDPVEATAMNVLDYIRGEEIAGFRARTRKLGDIVHSAPLFLGNTIYVGGNDGMLHAFNATTGKERFAYVPNLVFDNLKYLTAEDYADHHRFFVDLTPMARSNVPMGEDDTGTLLVGGLAKGGKGYYALDITDADSLDSSATETQVASMVKWEYPKVGVTDDDLGYGYSRAFIVRTYSTTYPWVIIFGNGYNSTNGKAMLYILDLNGNLITKIDTGVGDANGLSTPSLVDKNGDFKVDYAYAGDLKGNLWKFDLTAADYNQWQVAFGTDNNGDHKISFADGDVPKPLFTAPGQPITIKPDVMRHCDEHGYIVVFGTGSYLDSDPPGDPPVQTVYGIWDYGDDDDNGEVLGTFDRATGVFSNTPLGSNVTLLEQTELPGSPVFLYGYKIRLTTDYEPNWETIEDADTGQLPNPGSSNAETIVHAGWYFDLPVSGERVIKDLMIRDGMAVFTSFTPNDSECSGGGNSMVHEMNACTGARPLREKPQFDINNDGVIDENDLVNIGTDDDPNWIAPTGKEYTGLLHPPVVLTMPDRKREMKVFSTSAGTTVTLFERGERRGIFYWVERTGN